MVRLFLLAAVAGVAAVQLMPALPPQPGRWALLAALALAVAMGWPRLPGRLLLGVVLAFAVGFGYGAWRAHPQVADALDPTHENLVTRLVIQVTGLSTRVTGGQRFEARVLHSPVSGVPQNMLVGWYDTWGQSAKRATDTRAPSAMGSEEGGAALVKPGQVYSAALVLKRPHGLFNPHAFDYEAWMFERGLRASATVRGVPRLLHDDAFADFDIAVQRMRHLLRQALAPYLADTRYGPVVLALAMGDQASVAKDDWLVFNRLGITHLVSISGSHVTILAAGAALAGIALWKRLRWRATPMPEYVPAQVVGAAIALLIAWLYCLVAGWGVPAQRTFFMLATVAGTAMLRVPLTPSRVLIAAAALVTAFDPWAPLAPGFWLSFGAVAVLMLAGSGRWRAPAQRPWVRALGDATGLQLAITVALLPVLAFQFHEVSFASPLANAVAIPVVSFVVTPLALAGMIVAPLPGIGPLGGGLAWLAERAFRWMMVPIDYLAHAEWAMLPVAAPPWWWVALACLGIAWALQAQGLPGRYAAWLLVIPSLMYQPAKPVPGTFRLTVLDVGQGSATVIETATRVVVVDTGAPFGSESDAGERVVWPYLRARGISKIDDLVITHADVDHAGGVMALLNNTQVRRIRASYDLPGRLADASAAYGAGFAPCRAGQGWVLDGVLFTFLHPEESTDKPRDANGNSCVLRVQSRAHSALILGDIGKAQEQQLVRRYASTLRADVVLMAHHGSLTSSSHVLIDTVQAKHAVAQAGYLSRFGHPRPEVVERWLAAGAEVHRSDHHGAVVFAEHNGQLRSQRHRDVGRRYWHTYF